MSLKGKEVHRNVVDVLNHSAHLATYHKYLPLSFLSYFLKKKRPFKLPLNDPIQNKLRQIKSGLYFFLRQVWGLFFATWYKFCIPQPCLCDNISCLCSQISLQRVLSLSGCSVQPPWANQPCPKSSETISQVIIVSSFIFFPSCLCTATIKVTSTAFQTNVS